MDQYPTPPTTASLPYPEPDGTFTTGHSGSEASREARVSERDNGTVALRQNYLLDMLHKRGPRGLTVEEVRSATMWHHGQASAILSNLHKAEKIMRLDEKRGRCHVYVLPQFSQGRPAKPQGRPKPPTPPVVRDAFYAGFEAGVGFHTFDATEQHNEFIAWIIERGD